MRARAEGELFVLREARVRIHRHVVEIPKRRHRARLAIGKGVFELALRSDLDPLGARQGSQSIKVKVQRCRNHRHRQDAINFDNHRLCQFLARHMRQSGDSLSGVSNGMCSDQVLDVVRVEKLAKLRQRHKTSSLRGKNNVEGTTYMAL
jgi:hypothetical protein